MVWKTPEVDYQRFRGLLNHNPEKIILCGYYSGKYVNLTLATLLEEFSVLAIESIAGWSVKVFVDPHHHDQPRCYKYHDTRTWTK